MAGDLDALSGHVRRVLPRPREEVLALYAEADVFVLPSFSEGLPLVLVEALACGCRLVATRLPGVVSGLAEPLGDALDLVDLPRLERVDQPDPRDLPAFVETLAAAKTD